ncbi:MAG: APC family permease, partial [Thermoguttaceae bacterium]
MSSGTTGAKPGLKRVLGLWALVIYGIILVQPTGAMPLYGVICDKAHGHVVTTILIAMVAMLFTAISYGRMANAYPSAGSAYTYVGQELHSSLGYLTGWAMVFDYLLNPVISVMFCSYTARRVLGWVSERWAAWEFLQRVPYWAWALFFAVLFTGMNLRGIQSSARTNKWIAAGLMVVVVLFLLAAGGYIWADPQPAAGRFLRPFYDPQSFDLKAVSSGAALAMLTYIGFDAISTLSEEAHNPRRNILLATVLTCVVTGVLAGSQVYAASMVWPSNQFPDPPTATGDIAGRAGGTALFVTVNLALLVAQIGSGAGAHMAGGRLLYGMGRDNAIPRRFFGALNPRTRIPQNNIILVGVIALLGGLVGCFEHVTLSLPQLDLGTKSWGPGLAWRKVTMEPFDLACEMLNFGALIGFMGVNLSALVRYYVRGNKKNLLNLLLPLVGFLICLYLWYNLLPMAQIVGLSWLATGFLYGAWKTNWFHHKIEFTVPDEETITAS